MITTVETPSSRCLWGMLQADITPPVSIYHRMWGAATHDRATGIHRPLLATAVAFAELDDTEATHPFVMVALDHCLFWSSDMAELRTAVIDAHGLKPEQLLITFSHTHASGLMDRSRSDLPGGEWIAPYFERLCVVVDHVVRSARYQMAPVTISYATGRCDLAGHRDAWDEDSRQWVCGWNPGGSADDTVLVARVTNDVSQIAATIVNYACHPTTLAWENTLISPDYVGALRETIERATDGAPCLFLQGASGDLGPRDGYVGDTAVADRNGRQLAYAALSAIESMPPSQTTRHYWGPVVSGATLGTWTDEPWTVERRNSAGGFAIQRVIVPLPYRSDRPQLPDLQREREQWLERERTTFASANELSARDARAMVERLTRALTRWSHCPPGDTFPYELTLLRLGDAVWLFAEGEPYQLLQTELRRRCPDRTIFVVDLADGWRCSYLPTRETFGRGVYQEQVAILAPGCLERVIDAAVEAVERI